MSESVIDSLFEDTIMSDLPMPGTELDFFIDHLPVDDISTFTMRDVYDEEKKEENNDMWEFSSEQGDNKYVKKELLSDGGSPDSSGTDLYSNPDEEESSCALKKNLLNVDIFLNKPKHADNDVMVNIPQRGSVYTPTTRITHRTRVTTDDIRCSTLKGRDITEDERKMLQEDGVAIPYNVILTKNEERALKKVRRKIKNKISAAESRKRRKEYIGGLEKRVEEHTIVNVKLQNTIDELQKHNRRLMDQLKNAANSVKKVSIGSQTTTCLMGVFLSLTFFFFPLFNAPFQQAAEQSTSNYIPGRSLLSISDTPKASFIETMVDYIAEKFDDMDLYTFSSPEVMYMKNDTLFYG